MFESNATLRKECISSICFLYLRYRPYNLGTRVRQFISFSFIVLINLLLYLFIINLFLFHSKIETIQTERFFHKIICDCTNVMQNRIVNGSHQTMCVRFKWLSFQLEYNLKFWLLIININEIMRIPMRHLEFFPSLNVKFDYKRFLAILIQIFLYIYFSNMVSGCFSIRSHV